MALTVVVHCVNAEALNCQAIGVCSHLATSIIAWVCLDLSLPLTFHTLSLSLSLTHTHTHTHTHIHTRNIMS